MREGGNPLALPSDVTPGPASRTATIADSLRDVAHNLSTISEFWRQRLQPSVDDVAYIFIDESRLDRDTVAMLRRATSESGTQFEYVVNLEED
jgi:hypothetical protein